MIMSRVQTRSISTVSAPLESSVPLRELAMAEVVCAASASVLAASYARVAPSCRAETISCKISPT